MVHFRSSGVVVVVWVGEIPGGASVIDEVTLGGHRFSRRKLYVVMIKFAAPVLLFVLLLQSVGIFEMLS